MCEIYEIRQVRAGEDSGHASPDANECREQEGKCGGYIQSIERKIFRK